MRIRTRVLFMMLIGPQAGLTSFWLALLLCSPLQAAESGFDLLLAKARSQAAVGHRFAPAGDNVAETVLTLYKLISIATPRQLDSFSTLIDGEDLIQTKLRNDPPLTETIPAAE